jgi:hypothetical protein
MRVTEQNKQRMVIADTTRALSCLLLAGSILLVLSACGGASSGPEEVEKEVVEVTFPDARLEAAIREAFDKPGGPILASELDGRYSLQVSRRGIADLTGLEHCTNLGQLWLHGNEISDISPLAALGNLHMLMLEGNQISDISPLASLTDLRSLNLNGNQISDISPLTSLTSLTSLNLYGNKIGDISPLASLTGLRSLNLSGNRTSDISPLASTARLTSLNLNGNRIRDIRSLASLTDLTSLNLSDNQTSDISSLASLTNLTSLNLSDNQIGDISPLASLPNLRSLNLNGNQISDISPLASLTNLTDLYLFDNPLGTASVDVHVPQLQRGGVHVSWQKRPESYIVVPESITVRVGEQFTAEITLRHMRSELAITIPPFTSDPERGSLQVPITASEGQREHLTEVMIEPSRLDIVALHEPPEITLTILPDHLSEYDLGDTLEIRLEFTALKTGSLQIAVALKPLTGEDERIIQKVIEITVNGS